MSGPTLPGVPWPAALLLTGLLAAAGVLLQPILLAALLCVLAAAQLLQRASR